MPARAPLILRIVLLIGVAALLLWPPIGRDAGAANAGADSSRPVVRRSSDPPTLAELDSLEGLGVPIFATLPERAARAAVVTPPRSPRVDRAAAVGWRVSGAAGELLDVVLSDESGAIDSVTVALDDAGAASGAFRVRPAREGWHEWSVALRSRTDGGASSASAQGTSGSSGDGNGPATSATVFVLPARKLRVLLEAGTASVEGREVARALEAAGAELTVLQALGRGLAPGGVPAAIPTAPDALDGYDAVVILGDASPTSAEARAVAGFVEDGGGVLVASRAATDAIANAGIRIAGTSAEAGSVTSGASSGSAAVAGAPAEAASAGTVRGDSILWSLPAEIPPLPSADIDVAAHPLSPVGVGVSSAASSLGSLLVLGAVGRGRMAALGLEETWRWGLEGGRGEGLEAFWQGIGEWLAGGARADLVVEMDPLESPRGVPVRVTVRHLGGDAALPTHVQVVHADSSREDLALAWSGDAGVATMVPSADGTTQIRLAGEPVGAHRARSTAEGAGPVVRPSDAWARLALLASSSGGAALPSDPLDARLEESDLAGRRRIPPTLWLAALLLIAGAEWGIRRFRGMA